MRGVPVWSHAGIVCTGETYKEKVKLTFLPRSLAGRPDRALQLRVSTAHPGERSISSRETASTTAAFTALVTSAVTLNDS